MKTNCNLCSSSRFYALLAACAAITAFGQPRSTIEEAVLKRITGAQSRETRAESARTPFKPMVLLSPDGQHSAVTTRDGRIQYRHVRDGIVQRTVYGCKPMALAFSPDGGRLAYAGNGNRCGRGDEITVKVWEVNGRKPATRLSVKSERANAIAIGRNRVVVASEFQIQCFSIPSGDPVWSIANRAGICELKFSKDESRLVVSFEDGTVTTYDAVTGVEHANR